MDLTYFVTVQQLAELKSGNSVMAQSITNYTNYYKLLIKWQVMLNSYLILVISFVALLVQLAKIRLAADHGIRLHCATGRFIIQEQSSTGAPTE